MHKQNTVRQGFTIVELLIVIVVIAILAAISVVAYTGIQQRATNSSIVTTVSQVVRLISGYKALNDNYPLAAAPDSCIVSGRSSCTAGGSPRTRSSSLDNNLRTISSLPSAVPDARPDYNGITYSYASSGRTVNGAPLNVVLLYSLIGTAQPCGTSEIVLAGTWNSWTTSATGYTSSSDGYTTCIIAVP